MLDNPAPAHDTDLGMHSDYVNPCVLFVCLHSPSFPCLLVSVAHYSPPPLANVGLSDNAIDKAYYQAALLTYAECCIAKQVMARSSVETGK